MGSNIELLITPRKGVRRITRKGVTDAMWAGRPIKFGYTTVGAAESVVEEIGIPVDGTIEVFIRFIGLAGISGSGCTIRGFVFAGPSRKMIPVEVIAKTTLVAGKITLIREVQVGSEVASPQETVQTHKNLGVFEFPPDHPALRRPD